MIQLGAGWSWTKNFVSPLWYNLFRFNFCFSPLPPPPSSPYSSLSRCYLLLLHLIPLTSTLSSWKRSKFLKNYAPRWIKIQRTKFHGYCFFRSCMLAVSFVDGMCDCFAVVVSRTGEGWLNQSNIVAWSLYRIHEWYRHENLRQVILFTFCS